MDDPTSALESSGLQRPHRDFAPRPPDFLPLRLVLLPGGLCIEVTQPDTLLGRHSHADIRLAYPEISRRHCRFVFADGHWKVVDLDSLNGVFVNDERMHEAAIYDGDRLRLGQMIFAVQTGVPTTTADVLPLPRAG